MEDNDLVKHICNELDYFLPVKRLQEHLNRLTSLLEIQRLQILGGLFGRE